MNQAHLHMVFNHFPIIGLFFGIGILAFGIFKKHTILVNTAYVMFIFCMIMAKATMMTGEGAEEMAEELGLSHDLIHTHEEFAETYMKALYVLGIVSILGLVANIKKHSKALIISFIVMILAIGSAALSKSVGTSGGEIRHTEIRENTANTSSDIKNESKQEEGNDH